MKENIHKKRDVMKSYFDEAEEIKSDQQLGKPFPLLEKPCPENAKIIELPKPGTFVIEKIDLSKAIFARRSHRKFKKEPLSIEELSYLLWATQGIKKVIKQDEKPYCTMRNVPSAGARHPFETYLLIHDVRTLSPGMYRYLPFEHKLCHLFPVENQKKAILEATFQQKFTAECSAVFIWSCIPYRAEWRYSVFAHKAMLLDAGHICQNLYLACETIEAGTCAIAAYSQDKVDALIGVDGMDEFSVYLSPVGKV
jgi:SagB-type dehydrogenase family enzyme